MPYSPRDNAEAWCRGLTRGPVKAEIAGSNPVASAGIPEPLGSGIFSRRASHPSNGSARISFGMSFPIESRYRGKSETGKLRATTSRQHR